MTTPTGAPRRRFATRGSWRRGRRPFRRRESSSTTSRRESAGRRNTGPVGRATSRARGSVRRFPRRRKIDPREAGSKPVHQTTFATSRTRPSSSRAGRRGRRHPGRARHARAVRSVGFTRISAPPSEKNSHAPSADWRAHRQHPVKDESEHEAGEEEPAGAPDRNGTCPVSRPEHPRPVTGTATSRAISAPELPAPTSRTPPSRS